MPGRKYQQGLSSYRYGINGQERSAELNDNSYTAEYWQYDSRIGRRWNRDPIVKEYESPFATFGNNPIIYIDKDGSDTINITHTTTREKRGSIKSNLDNYGSKKIPDIITRTGDINIKQAEGNDVFKITEVNVTIDENGNKTSASTTTALELNGKQSDYRYGGRNMKGYSDDRFALAAYVPRALLQYYADKNIGFDKFAIQSVIAYQKDVSFALGLGKVMNVAYTISGVYGIARMGLAASLPASARPMESFFAGTKYTSKVWTQIYKGDYHSFPEGVKAFESAGIRTFEQGGDKVWRWHLRIPGSYDGKNGVFHFIKEADGSINHRLFEFAK